MKIIRNILVIATIAIYFSSCTSDECVFNTETYLTLEINVVDTNLINAGFLDSLSIYSPAWTDSIYSEKTGSAENILLSLSPENDLTTIIITSVPFLEKDTIIFYHQKDLVFLSPECGFIFTFTIDSFINTANFIDSVKLVNNELTIDEEGSFKIYF
jgi:hypothetical protein